MNKAFETLRARAALAGIPLLRSDPRDGQVRVLAFIRGVWRELRTPDDVEALVIHAGGVAQ